MDKIKDFLWNWKGISLPFFLMAGAIILGLAGYYIFIKTIERIGKGTKVFWIDSFVKHCHGSVRIIFPVLAIDLILPLIIVPPRIFLFLKQTLGLLLIFSMAWFIIKLLYVFEDLILSQYRVDVRDNLEARRIHTQIQILKKIAILIIGVITLATALMAFEKVRQLGTTILASAGIVGIIVGFAAQRSIATLLAGIQMAITQPIRIDDVVIVEGEWGRIEEITLTYVVVRIWDLRRLIIPMTYFLEKPFQNWTRVSADLLGTVFIYVDYTVPVNKLRAELKNILESSQRWDKKVCGLQVTNTTEHAMELRALMSAPDSSTAWELRCEVREKLIAFIKKNYPSSLPRVRAEFGTSDKNECRKPISED